MKGRKNAMLTTEDRRWLLGEKVYEGEYAKQQRYQRRREIRERVANSILDFTILFDYLEPAEREKLFADVDLGDRDSAPFIDGLRDAVAFILSNTGITTSMLDERETAGDRKETIGNEPLASWLLKEALYRAGRDDDILVESVDLRIQATEVPLLSLLDDIESGKELSPGAIRVLLEHEQVDVREVQTLIREMITSGAAVGTDTKQESTMRDNDTADEGAE